MAFLDGMKRVVDKILNGVMVVTFTIIFMVVLAQILWRYGLRSPLIWSEELSRYIFIWVSLLGWALASRSGSHIRITFLQDRLPPSIRRWLNIFFHLCTLALLGLLVWLGIRMSALTFNRGAVTLPLITQGMIYLSLPVSAILCMFYVLYDIIRPSNTVPAVME